MSPCYCIALRNGARKISAIYDEALSPLAVNVAQYSLLRHIGHFAPVSLTALAKKTELDRSTVGRNVKVLARDGLVVFGEGEDQREALAALTKKGRRLLSDAEPLWRKAQARIEATLGREGVTQMRALLQRL